MCPIADKADGVDAVFINTAYFTTV